MRRPRGPAGRRRSPGVGPWRRFAVDRAFASSRLDGAGPEGVVRRRVHARPRQVESPCAAEHRARVPRLAHDRARSRSRVIAHDAQPAAISASSQPARAADGRRGRRRAARRRTLTSSRRPHPLRLLLAQAGRSGRSTPAGPDAAAAARKPWKLAVARGDFGRGRAPGQRLPRELGQHRPGAPPLPPRPLLAHDERGRPRRCPGWCAGGARWRSPTPS